MNEKKKNILLDAKLLNEDYNLGKLIQGLVYLTDKGFKLFIDNPEFVDECKMKIISSEGIELFEIDEKESYLKLSSKKGSNDLYVEPGSDFYDFVTKLFNEDRTAYIERKTKETNIACRVNLDGSGKSEINTGIGFFDHMLEQISKHGNIDLEIKVKGDLNVDEHHTVEDTGIVLGQAISKAVGDKKGIRRYGFLLPMDDCIAKVAIDLGGRSFLNYKVKFTREKIGELPTELVEEFFRALSNGMQANLYIRSKGKNEHHKIEAIFKAFAKALNDAVRIDERSKNNLPSTKGVL